MFWLSSGVQLTSPLQQYCVDVVSQLVTEIHYSSSPESTLLQIHQTELRELETVSLMQCLLNNQLKRLYFWNAKLIPVE